MHAKHIAAEKKSLGRSGETFSQGIEQLIGLQESTSLSLIFKGKVNFLSQNKLGVETVLSFLLAQVLFRTLILIFHDCSHHGSTG